MAIVEGMETINDTAGMGERVLWTLLVGAATGAAGLLTARLAAWSWRRLRGHAPPESLALVSWLARSLGEGAATSLMR